MCNPYLLQAAGTGVGAMGQYQEGQDAASAAGFNARASDLQAQDALRRGSQDEARYMREIRQVEGAQKAAFGASNVTRSGTALDVIGDTAMIADEDIQTIRNNAAREAYGFRTQGQELRRQAKAYRRTGLLRSGSTLLTGGAQAYGMWKQAKA